MQLDTEMGAAKEAEWRVSVADDLLVNSQHKAVATGVDCQGQASILKDRCTFDRTCDGSIALAPFLQGSFHYVALGRIGSL